MIEHGNCFTNFYTIAYDTRLVIHEWKKDNIQSFYHYVDSLSSGGNNWFELVFDKILELIKQKSLYKGDVRFMFLTDGVATN
jgi:hypothetical protein